MKKRLLIASVLVAAVGCSQTPETSNVDENNGAPATGKADSFDNDQDACEATGGLWTDDSADAYYCMCGAADTFVSGEGCKPRDEVRGICEATGGTFEEGLDWAYCSCPSGQTIDHGNCLAPDPAEEALCVDSGGTWTDDASDSYYCICEDGSSWVADAGCASDEQIENICSATGGQYWSGEDYAYCQCGDRVAETGNCLAPDPAEEAACLADGGTWTDDSSDSYYCVCAAGQSAVRGEGCVDTAEVQGLCEATGGTYESGDDYAYCACPGDRYFDHGNCFATNPVNEYACNISGGTWTDDASDSYYCICADGTEVWDGTPCAD